MVHRLEKVGKEEQFSSGSDKDILSATVKKYTLKFESILGMGAFGLAYKVTDLADNTRFLKIIFIFD
jgi:hypothetical protein